MDTYAWVNYTTEGADAPRISELLDSEVELFTPSSVIAELNDVMLRHRIAQKRRPEVLEYVKSRTEIVVIDAEMAERAGEINYELKRIISGWGMLDSFVWAVAIKLQAYVLTGDPHFQTLFGVEMLK